MPFLEQVKLVVCASPAYFHIPAFPGIDKQTAASLTRLDILLLFTIVGEVISREGHIHSKLDCNFGVLLPGRQQWWTRLCSEGY